MKTSIILVIMALSVVCSEAQNDLSALKRAWCRVTFDQIKMNANKKRSIEYEQNVYQRLNSYQQRANSITLSLNYPNVVQTKTTILRQTRYRSRSMSPREMDAYEAEINSVLANIESQISNRERSIHQAWRQDNPVEARIEDAQKAAIDAEMRAVTAQAEAERKARAARESEMRAINAENTARLKEDEARRLEWQAQQAEQRARDAENRYHW